MKIETTKPTPPTTKSARAAADFTRLLENFAPAVPFLADLLADQREAKAKEAAALQAPPLCAEQEGQDGGAGETAEPGGGGAVGGESVDGGG